MNWLFVECHRLERATKQKIALHYLYHTTKPTEMQSSAAREVIQQHEIEAADLLTESLGVVEAQPPTPIWQY
jgi:hypothetical protein